MTIGIRITNMDTRETAVVSVKTQNIDGSPVVGIPDVELTNGDSASAYVHSGQKIVVEEVSKS